MKIFFQIILIVLSMYVFVETLNQKLYPHEDAAILMRYSEHLRDGYGIVWNKNEEPVDGATDFLFMITIAIISKIGISIEDSTKLISLLSHIFTVIIIFYFGISKKNKNLIYLSFLFSLMLLFGPGLNYINAYFGTTFFVFFISVSFSFHLKFLQNPNKSIYFILFSVFSLVSSLIRPEGVILTILMLILLIFIKHNSVNYYLLIYIFILFYVLPGIIYFSWRWIYFGYPLPNTFYKKGGGILYPSTFLRSVLNTFIFFLPLVPFFLLELKNTLSKKKFVFSYLTFIFLFNLSFILISGEMNYAGRFQYVIFPMTLLFILHLIKNIFNYSVILQFFDKSNKFIINFLIFIYLLSFYLYSNKYFLSDDIYADGRYEIAKILSNYASENYTMAISEAGLLPFYSKWKAVDTYGLNDKVIAHTGVITQSYLKEKSPEMIMFYNIKKTNKKNNIKLVYFMEMIDTLIQFTSNNNYELVGSFGIDKSNTHDYYIKRDFRDYSIISNEIRKVKYYWGNKTRTAKNFVE